MPNNYVLLDRIELNNTAASVTFDNIPQSGYTDLKLVVSARSTATPGVPDDGLFLQVNSITSGYSNKTLYGTGSSALSASNSYGITSKTYISALNTANSTANTFNNTEVYIPNYRSSVNKSISIDGVIENNATATITNLTAALLSNTAAISGLTLTPNSGLFVANSTFSLYGLAQVGTTPAIAPKADGGNVIGTDGTYWYHQFNSNGTFTPQVGLTCDVLVVAGGGGGAGGRGGGGGAGGFRTSTGLSLLSSLAVTVGAGGTAAPNGSVNGSNGFDSVFSSITSTGGGGGGRVTQNGLSGGSGSGGGGADNTGVTSGGAASPSGQGNAGGNGYQQINAARGGGGGGAGVAGTAGTSGNAGNGGNGLTNLYSGSSVTYAGGGGGGYDNRTPATQSIGGTGGGGNGGSNSAGFAGTANTGGGGGAGCLITPSLADAAGGNGGSGVVIIRYLVA